MVEQKTGKSAYYVKFLYDVLDSLQLFSKAKEACWQTFFHHTASVASAAYRIAFTVKQALTGAKLASLPLLSIKKIEKEASPLTYEDLLFLSGVAHDYVKIHGKQKTDAMEKILSSFIDDIAEETFEELPRERKKDLIDKILAVARATESLSSTELDEAY
ncbi:MAG: hypothetical protein DRJ52_10995, partial [Thermoprotei archaeon]